MILLLYYKARAWSSKQTNIQTNPIRFEIAIWYEKSLKFTKNLKASALCFQQLCLHPSQQLSFSEEFWSVGVTKPSALFIRVAEDIEIIFCEITEPILKGKPKKQLARVCSNAEALSLFYLVFWVVWNLFRFFIVILSRFLCWTTSGETFSNNNFYFVLRFLWFSKNNTGTWHLTRMTSQISNMKYNVHWWL